MERQLISDLISASKTSEIDDIVFKYSDILDENRRLYSFVRNARKRIHNLRKIKFELTEIIYLN